MQKQKAKIKEKVINHLHSFTKTQVNTALNI